MARRPDRQWYSGDGLRLWTASSNVKKKMGLPRITTEMSALERREKFQTYDNGNANFICHRMPSPYDRSWSRPPQGVHFRIAILTEKGD
jgi:hypothetical protein